MTVIAPLTMLMFRVIDSPKYYSLLQFIIRMFVDYLVKPTTTTTTKIKPSYKFWERQGWIRDRWLITGWSISGTLLY